jgi:hypothetical protein
VSYENQQCPPKHVINFSGGLCSFWAAHRVVQRHGTKGVVLLFADTLIEDDELYTFNDQASALLGIPITRICVGLTPWQLFRKQGLIANSKYPICSVYLKREPLDEWHRTHCLELGATLYIGFDWTEQFRLDDLRAAKPFWRIEAPMTEPPFWDKCRMQTEAEKLGLKIPRLYGLGFPHNNCGGRCVRAGISHWVHLYRTLPHRYAEWEAEEQQTITELNARGIAAQTMLKDRRGGSYKPMTLADLRKRIEAGEKLPRFDWGGCGCGGATSPESVKDSSVEQTNDVPRRDALCN